jgi:lysozyme
VNPITRAQLEQELRGDEGERLRVYDDATGKPIGPGSTLIGNPTIAVGRNLSGRGITAAESAYLLDNDCTQAESDLSTPCGWISNLSAARQTVIYSLYFNVGLGNPNRFLAAWPHFLGQMQAGQFEEAATNLETSQPWASQVGPRAKRLADLVRSG